MSCWMDKERYDLYFFFFFFVIEMEMSERMICLLQGKNLNIYWIEISIVIELRLILN